jgi:anti-sigma-K factor RskA
VIGEHPDREDLVAYVLGGLEPAEAREVEAHAPGCARCTRELEALGPAVAVLAESVEQMEPPPELRERVMAEVHGDVARVAEARQRPERPRARRSGWRGLFTRPAIAVALAIVVAAVGGYAIAGNNGGDQQTSVPVVAQQGIGGTLALGENTSVLDLHGLSQLSGRQVYQVWVANGQSVRPSSNFIPDANGRAMTAVDGHLAGGTTVMVTREPHPGETRPTSPALLSATVE